MAALFGAVGSGVAATLSYYIYTFLWEFSTQQIGFISISVVISAMLGFMLSPFISKRLGKKKGRFYRISGLHGKPRTNRIAHDGIHARAEPNAFPIMLPLSLSMWR